MATITIDKDRMYGISNSFRYFIESTEEFDSEREKLNDYFFTELAKINNRSDKFCDQWATEMDRDFPGWRTFVLGEVHGANS